MTPLDPVFEEASIAPVVEPSLLERLKYRLGLSIPERYRGWVERDVNSKRFLWWHVAHLWVGAAIATGLARLVVDDYNPIPFLIGWAVATVAQLTLFSDYNRRKFLRYHEKRWARTRERDVSPDVPARWLSSYPRWIHRCPPPSCFHHREPRTSPASQGKSASVGLAASATRS